MAFWCPICGQREDRRQRMMQHISRRHEYIAEGSQFTCGSCGHVRSHNLVTHCLKHARDDALTAYWFKTDGKQGCEGRGKMTCFVTANVKVRKYFICPHSFPNLCFYYICDFIP